MTETLSRIVSLTPSTTEIVAALGLLDRLVAVDEDSDHPVEVERLPRVGRGIQIDTTLVTGLRPGLVVTTLGMPGMELVLAKLEHEGIRCIALAPKSLHEVGETFLAIGEATGTLEAAQQLVDRLNEGIERVATIAAGAESYPSVYWEWWPKPLVTPGRLSWVTDMIEMAGGANVFGDVEQESPAIDEDQVFAKAPEVMVACWCGAERMPEVEKIRSRRGWGLVPAVRDNRVYVVPEGIFERPGPRLIDGIEQLGKMLHPELFE